MKLIIILIIMTLLIVGCSSFDDCLMECYKVNDGYVERTYCKYGVCFTNTFQVNETIETFCYNECKPN